MLLKYIEPKNKIEVNPQQQIKIENLIKLEKSIANYEKDFFVLLDNLDKNQLLKSSEIKRLKYYYEEQINKDVDKYSSGRMSLFNEFQNQLPNELIGNLIIENEKISKEIDPIGLIGSQSSIKIKNLQQYIEENGLIMFPTVYLRPELKNSQINSIISHAENMSSDNKSYIVTTLNNIDLHKILEEGNFELNNCIISKSSEMILMSFLFQLPLLQSLNKEIQSLKKNNTNINNKIEDIQAGIEKFVNHQFKINENFNNKITEIVDNLQKLNNDNLIYREEKRKENPTYTYVDDSILLQGEYTEYLDSDGFWGQKEKVVKYFYHPIATALKEKSIVYNINHLITKNNNLPEISYGNDIDFDQIKTIVQHDLKNNFICILANDISNIKETANVLCSFGSGYSPVTQVTFVGLEEIIKEPIKTITPRKGYK